MKFYIYRLTFENGATYIGEHLEKKENDGYISSSKYMKDNPNLNFKREILIDVEDEETMHIMETLCIMKDKCENNFNVNGTLGSWVLKYTTYRGKFVTDETRQKLSKASTGRHHTEEAKAKISKAQKGVKETPETRAKAHENALKAAATRKANGYIHSKETKQKISESNKGKRKGCESPFKGHTFSEDSKQKLSKSLKEFYREHPELIEKIKEARKWYKPSEETKHKMSESHKGKHIKGHIQTDKTRQKISEKLKGVKKPKFTEEHKKHIREAAKKVANSIENKQKRSKLSKNRKWVTDGIKSYFIKNYEKFLKENPSFHLGRAKFR